MTLDNFHNWCDRNAKLEEVLNMKLDNYDFNRTITFREWMGAVLKTLFCEGEGFSGKRPFGNSGWECYINRHLTYLDPSIIKKVTVWNSEKKSYDEVDISNLENTPIEEWPWYDFDDSAFHQFDFDEKKTKKLFNEVVNYLITSGHSQKYWEDEAELTRQMEEADEAYGDDPDWK